MRAAGTRRSVGSMASLPASAGRPAPRPPRSGFLDECGPAADGLRWQCPAVVIPAGARRFSADLPSARAFVVEDGAVLLRAAGGAGARHMVLALCSPRDVVSPPASDELFHALTDTWLTAVSPAAWRQML